MDQGGSHRLIIDCNWFVSASINRRSRRRLYHLFSNQRFAIVYSDELLAEYKRVITSQKYSHFISDRQVTRFINFIQARMIKVEILSNMVKSRDPKDNYLLGLSKDSSANYLITGDKDLLVLKKFGRTEIVTMMQFETIFFPQS